MADKTISELTAAEQVQAADLFVLEQSGTAKKLTGQTLENWLLTMADGHGGIQTIAKVNTSGLNDTYRITFSDTTSTTFTVTNGRGIAGLTWTTSGTAGNGQNHTGTFTYNDGTTSSVTIKDGIKGDTGATGATGPGAQLIAANTQYLASASDSSVAPLDGWSPDIPQMRGGWFLWTKTTIAFDTGEPVIFYSKTKYGVDGSGAVSAVNNVGPDGSGNVAIGASDIPTTSSDVQSELSSIGSDVRDLKTWQSNFTASTITAVSYGANQSLNATQKETARNNIGIALSSLATTSQAVLADQAQTFTASQQAQARDNIGATAIDVTEETTSQSYSIAASNFVAVSLPLSRTGYTPIGIVGWYSSGTGNSWPIMARCRIYNNAVDCIVRNPSATAALSLAFTFTVLWRKDS